MKNGKGQCSKCAARYEEKIENAFARLGSLLSKHPMKIMACCVFVNILLAFGFINIKFQNDIEVLYVPQNSKSLADRNKIESVYKDPTGHNFAPYQLTRTGTFGDILIISKNSLNIMEQIYIEEINSIDSYIRNEIVVHSSNESFRYEDICAVTSVGCGVVGYTLLSPEFQTDFVAGNVTYPFYDGVSLTSLLANPISENGYLKHTTGVKLRYYLRQNTTEVQHVSKQWEKIFVESLKNLNTNLTSIAFSHSDSLNSEMDKITESAAIFFAITMALMVVYASFSTAPFNCNNVANRMNLGFAGIVAALLAIGSSFGLVMTCGVEFTTVVGVVPFLVTGIGIDDMFILMSGMADAPPLSKATIEERMAFMLKKSGIAITITSLTDLLAFIIGATSVFVSIRIFCIYTAVALLHCYLNQLFFLCPAIAINETRTYQKRHFCCCTLKVKSVDNYQKESKSRCFIRCFAGHRPKSRHDVESPMEKHPKRLMHFVLQHNIGKTCVIVLFLAYITSSIYGTIHLGRGLEIYNLVSKESYYYKYGIWDETYFTSEPTLAVCIEKQLQYHLSDTQTRINSLMLLIKQDGNIDDSFEINWLASYKISRFYNNETEHDFIDGLKSFISSTEGKYFANDIVFQGTSDFILSSKFYLKTSRLKTSQEQGDFMLRIRQTEKLSAIPCILYSPIFVFGEQYIQILSTTMQTVGIALAAILFVKFFFMPNILIVVVVALTLLSILVGIFGFMHFWDLSLNSVTMIHLVMSVGFSVDFSVHICHAFMSIKESNREYVLQKSIDVTGGPIFNAAFSSMLGIAVLAISDNYVLLCFGKVMFLVLSLGLLHACLFLPLLLYFLMPCFPKYKNSVEPEKVKVELRYLETFTIYDPKIYKDELYNSTLELFESDSLSLGKETISEYIKEKEIR